MPTADSDNLIYPRDIHRDRMQEIMSSRVAKSERRKTSRKSPPSLVYVELGSTNGGMLRDLSAEGFALRAMMPLRPGDKTPFSIVLNSAVRIEGQGEVLWSEEHGRVAGLRFLEVSPQSLVQMQSWLAGTLESPEPQADSELSAAGDAQSFDQLRQELRSPSAKIETPAPVAAQPQVAPVSSARIPAPPVTPEPPPAQPQKEIPAEIHAPVVEAVADSNQTIPPPASEPAPPPSPFPGLPDFSSTQQAIEITFEALPPAPTPSPVPERFPRIKQIQTALPPTPLAQEEPPSLPPRESSLPDITQVLIQPPSREREFATNTLGLEPLGMQSSSKTASEESSFTISKALGIMALLILVVGLVVFRRSVGEGLIWLGDQLSGSHATSSSTPATSAEESVPSPTNSPAPSPETTQPSASSVNPPSAPASTTQENATEPAQQPPVQKPLPSVEKTAQPPVTPLAGISPAGGGTGTTPESGLNEYSKAMQLLHVKNGTPDTSEAVRLLWVSVEKGNASAELTLAEMYWHGEGVAHNCDQARILLSASARKGNADAQKRLKQFQQEGCE